MRVTAVAIFAVFVAAFAPIRSATAAGTADEIHYTFTGPTSVAFDWRGTATDIRYGPTTAYGSTASAHTPTPLPFSSAGPFQEVQLTGLTAGARYHYSIGGGPDHTFGTAPTGSFVFDVIGDIGSSLQWSSVATTQAQIANDTPAFVIMDGDLTYADPNGQPAVDQHFNDVMSWSQDAAYVPAWGNHEYQTPAADDLRNYKGRFVLPNPFTSPDAPSTGCCGDDASWFDAGGVRFISYPEPYKSTTWSTWQSQIEPVFAAAQADPSITFIVTFGHRPAYSTGLHPGEAALASILNTFGDRYSKYVLNLNGHSHDYERYVPIHGVSHITAAGGGSPLEPPWLSADSRTAYRAMHLEHVRVEVSSTGMRIEAICGPPTSQDDIACVQGSVIDSYVIGTNPPPPPPPPPILYVDKGNPNCSDAGSGTETQPFCTIKPAASRVVGGQTVLVSGGTYNEQVTVSGSGTSAAPIIFAAAPGATPTITGGTYGFYISGKSYVTVQGFNVTGTSDDGIVVKTNSSNITIRANHVSYCGQPVNGKTAKGIRIENSSSSIVEDNTVDHNTSYGIYVPSSTGILVRGNESFANAFQYQRAASGIRLYSSSGNTVSGNTSHDNEDSGIDVDKSTSNLIVNNVVANNGDHGIDNTGGSPGNRIIGNTVYKNVTAGINVEGTSTGVTIANNIAVDNGIASPRTHSNIRVESGSTSGTALNFDLVFLSVPDTMLIWNSVAYSSLAAFKSATGQEARGIEGSPGFVNASGADFNLASGSPAIDSANSGASGQQAFDLANVERVDDPLTPNTGTGPRAYDDRGAYELQPRPLASIVVSPASATTAAGMSKAYTAQGYDSGGTLVGDVTSSTTFTIAPDGSCVANVCTATRTGTHTVTATNEGVSGTATLTVTAGPLDHLALSPATATIASGGSQAYTAAGRDQYDNSLGDVTSTTTFSIAPNGSCTGATCAASVSGTHTVTGTKSGKTGTASLSVTAGTVDHIVISPASATIAAGESQTYTAQAFDASGNPLGDVTALTTFSMTPDGVCFGATCTATVAGSHRVIGNDAGMTSQAVLTVTAGPLDHLALSPASATIAAGGSQAYTSQGRDQYDNSLGDLTSSTTFSISPDGSCTGATCTATSSGPHTVTGSNGGKTGSATLTVTAAALDHLVLSPATATITAGQSQAYTAAGRDQYDNSLGDVTASTTFSISPNGSCTGASCTASVSGAHTVTGTKQGKAGTASLQVNPTVVDHIVISPASATIAAGGSEAYTAQGFDASNNSLGDVTASTTFSIAPNGSCAGATCTATTSGPHTVSGNDGGKTATASLTVTAAPLDHLALSPASATIPAGGSQAYTAQGRDQYDNSLGDVTASTTFSIVPNGSCTGASCTATLAGTHTVTGTSGGKTGTASLEVTASGVDHIVISPKSSSLAAGGSQAYTAQGFDSAGNSLGDVTAFATFSISPDGSCTDNVCTATTAGSHTVTADDGGKTDTASLTVTAGALDHLVLSPASATIASDGSQAYTAAGRDQYDNSLGDVTSTTTFSIAPDGSCTGSTCTASVAGTHTVTGTKAGKTGTASLSVTASGVVDHIVIRPTNASIVAGGSQAYTAQGFDAANNSLGDVTASTTFAILPDGSCTANLCTATGAGTHTVTGDNSGKTSAVTLTVAAGTSDHLALTPGSASITAGASQTFVAQSVDQYGNPLGDVTASTTFTISPNGSCTGATCTATVAGTHTVTGSSGGKTGMASLQVAAGVLDHITISPATATISVGGSQAYTAQGFDAANNSLGDVTGSTSFSIASEGSCTGATCTANVGGPHTVTGTSSGKTATASLAVSFVRNFGFETDTSGWNTSGSGANITLTRASGGHSGSWSAKLANTGSSNSTFATLQDSPNWVSATTAGTYTASAWVRADTAGAILKIKLQEYSGSTLLGSASAQITLGTSWQQITLPYTVKSPGSTLDFQIYVANAAPGTAFYADDASIVVG
ncbi:MAG TPA: right-handed parallel beta-helix repeat-containing protein [Candidatus Limnocylindrales bacterium]|nr:right-handed parallel beta-helix repeat-containing protein [Candidatus Limnocylindrales bacterium]